MAFATNNAMIRHRFSKPKEAVSYVIYGLHKYITSPMKKLFDLENFYI
jgi:hypothetical protein